MAHTPIVTIFGGSGFLGRYIALRMARAGWRVRVAVRRPNEAMFVQPYGDVGQVVPILANIRDAASTRRAISGADAVVNCVGIFRENKHQKFDVVQAEAANRIARLAAEEGVSKLVHVSSLWADADSDSGYASSKAKGDADVLRHFPNATILRPSVMFGTEDRFFNTLAEYSRMTPIMPVIGGQTKLQPVYVDDVAAAAEVAILGDAPGVFELGGPEVKTMRELMEITMDAVERKRAIIEMPYWFANMKAWTFDMFASLTGGLFPAIISRDQIKLIRIDNVVSKSAAGFDELGLVPTPMGSILGGYLYRLRASGQYAVTTNSGKNLNI